MDGMDIEDINENLERDYMSYFIDQPFSDDQYAFNLSSLDGIETLTDQTSPLFFNNTLLYIDQHQQDEHDYQQQQGQQQQGDKQQQQQELDEEREEKEEQKNRLAVKQIINNNMFPMERIKLWTGLTIMADGTLRLCSTLSTLSFNFQQQLVDAVEYKRNLGVVDLHLTKNLTLNECPLEDALLFLQRFKDIKFEQIAEKLHMTQNMINQLRKTIKEQQLTEQQLQLKDDDFGIYLDSCFDYLHKQYEGKNNTTQMYAYSIMRINFKDQDIEVAHIGFSKPYLDLLGLNESSLSSLYLRNQQICLLQERQAIINQSLKGLENKQKMVEEDTCEVKITTFDGFQLKLTQNKKIISNSSFFQSNVCGMKMEYFIAITEMDVDLQDLQKLIAYRQKIMQNPTNLSIEEYLQKELSYFFEDVEYSIHSQAFMEKFYSKNLQQIRKLENQLLQKEEMKPCGYKYIRNNINPQNQITYVS